MLQNALDMAEKYKEFGQYINAVQTEIDKSTEKCTAVFNLLGDQMNENETLKRENHNLKLEINELKLKIEMLVTPVLTCTTAVSIDNFTHYISIVFIFIFIHAYRQIQNQKPMKLNKAWKIKM